MVYRKIVQAGLLAQRLGARILGLGAFTSVVGDGGVTVGQYLKIPITTGHSLTVAVAVEALERAARCRGIQPEAMTSAVVGATDRFGSACAELLAPMVAELVPMGKRECKLLEVQERVRSAGARSMRVVTNVEGVCDADLVLSATGTTAPVIQPQHLRRRAIVCDVARPRDVSSRVGKERKDVLVIEEGIVDVPGEVDFGFYFGLPPGKAYACIAEAMLLALESRYRSSSVGKRVEIGQVREMALLAHKHAFAISGAQDEGTMMSRNRIGASPEQAIVADPVFARRPLQSR